MDIEVNLALSDWGEIPTHRIADVAAEARKRAGEFIPSNGLIAKIWREMQANRHEDAQRAIRAENNFRYLAAPPVATPEERAAMAEAARKISESLK